MIGVDENDIPIQMQSSNPSEIFSSSKILYMHSNDTNCQRRKVVKDFCFPNPSEEQILMQKLDNPEDVHKILYG